MSGELILKHGRFNNPLQRKADEIAEERRIETNKPDAAKLIYRMLELSDYADYKWRHDSFHIETDYGEARSLLGDANEYMQRMIRDAGSFFGPSFGVLDGKLAVLVERDDLYMKAWGIKVHGLEDLIASARECFNDGDREFGVPIEALSYEGLEALENLIANLDDKVPSFADHIWKNIEMAVDPYGFKLEAGENKLPRWESKLLVPK